MTEKIANIIIAILTISIFIVMVLFVALPSISYYQDSADISGDIVIGEANFEFVNELPLFSNLTNFIGGEVEENVTVINARDKLGQDVTNLINCYLRFKLSGSTNVVPNVDETNFTKSDDYYYYNGIFVVGQKLELISSFNVEEPTEEEYLNGLDVSVQVEVMQATKSMVSEVFKNAPQEWMNNLS